MSILNIQLLYRKSERFPEGVVGCGEGVWYLMSPGRPNNIGFQLARLFL